MLQRDLTGSGSFMGMIRVMYVLKLTRAALFLQMPENTNVSLLLNQFRLFCQRPSMGNFTEKTLEVHRNHTLGEATERAYKVDSTLMYLCGPTFS